MQGKKTGKQVCAWVGTYLDQMSGNEKIVDLALIVTVPAGISTVMYLLQPDPAWSQRMILIEKELHPRHKL